jgi:glutaredoxin
MHALLSRLVRPKSWRSNDLGHLTVTVYTRAGCCCCHTALDLLNTYRRRHGFAVETIDVDTDPALASAYGTAVPVVAVKGKVRFRGVVNPALLERLLTAESRAKGAESAGRALDSPGAPR